MESDNRFQVTLQLPDQQGSQKLNILHTDETFSFELHGSPLSIINNGDNSWSLVSGNAAQEIVNQIGDAIEQHYQRQTL